jgi:small GTP-binding protein
MPFANSTFLSNIIELFMILHDPFPHNSPDHPLKNKRSSFMTKPELKIVLLGETEVGKTTIISRFSHPEGMTVSPSPTVGACFTSQSVAVDEEEVLLKIWDTAGQERFRALTPMYYRGAHVAILVFAVDAPETFSKLAYWLEAVRKDPNNNPAIIIAGNKTDLPRKVTDEEGESFARNAEAAYLSCSAKLGQGITELFHHATALAVESKLRPLSDEPAVIEVKTVRKKKPCCK